MLLKGQNDHCSIKDVGSVTFVSMMSLGFILLKFRWDILHNYDVYSHMTKVSSRPIYNNIQLLTYVEVDMECYWTVNAILTDEERRSIWLSLLFNNTPCLPKHKSTIVLLYNKFIWCISCHFRPFKRWCYGWIMQNYLTFWRHFP